MRSGLLLWKHLTRSFESWIISSQISPLPNTAQHILDIGACSGIWAREVADKFPHTLVTCVGLDPPPETWVPPNCKLEGMYVALEALANFLCLLSS